MVTLSVDGQSEDICSYSIKVGPIPDPPPVVVEPGRPILMCITLLGKDAPFDQEETDSHWGPYLDAEETTRTEHLQLIKKAHLVPQPARKKHDGKDIFDPGEVFFMTMDTEKGPIKVAHVHWRPIVDCGEHYRFLNPDGTLGERVTSAIAVRTGF